MQLIEQYQGSLDGRAVAQRFEAKYIISELEAMAVRNFIEPYVRQDSNGAEYFVTSLYLDSPDLHTFWSSRTGEKNRFKLRVRAYDDDPESPVFFEIKRRTDQVIKKQRVMVARDAVADILNGADIHHDMLVRPTADGLENLFRFRDLSESVSATPRTAVRYLREAFVSNLEEPVRVTFDRYLECLPTATYSPEIWSAKNNWRLQNMLAVILEIKFTDSFPSWIKHLVRRFNLVRDSFAKYVVCVESLQREGIPVDDGFGNRSAWIS